MLWFSSVVQWPSDKLINQWVTRDPEGCDMMSFWFWVFLVYFWAFSSSPGSCVFWSSSGSLCPWVPKVPKVHRVPGAVLSFTDWVPKILCASSGVPKSWVLVILWVLWVFMVLKIHLVLRFLGFLKFLCVCFFGCLRSLASSSFRVLELFRLFGVHQVL